MKKMFNKAVLNGTTVMGDGLTYPRIPNVYTGDNEGGYQRGDMMDANAVVEMIKELTDTGKITIDELKNLINEEIQERVEGDQDQQRYTDEKIKDLIGTSPETLDTLKEIADALGEDPDFAANVWEKLAEVDQTLEDYKRASNLPKYVMASGEDSELLPISFVQDTKGIHLNINRTDLDTGDIVSTKLSNAIPKATQYMPGLMSAYDKIKTDRIPQDLVTSMSVVQDDPSNIKIKYYGRTLDGNSWHSNANIKPATSSLAGAMSSSDKVKLDSLVNYKAGNGINITGDTISCTLDTSLYSIVTELPETGLPNKIYLLPSTKTEEGNIYTEYGYVDNKWEEIGKYKADVDLSPYSKALYLPKYILGQDVDGGDIISSHYYPDKVKVKFVRVNLINNSNINDWFTIDSVTTAYAGVMSCIDKRKLDRIEKEAQVNKIESISVNGTPLDITNKGVNIPNATTSKDGMMSASDKTKLDSLKNYTLPAATNDTLGGVKVPTNIFKGSKNIKNHICINNGEVGANFELSYNKSNKRINFIIRTTSGGGVIDSITQSIDCTDFIKDGMLESANVEVNPEGHDVGTYIKLVFNTDAGKDPVYINVSDLIHEYTAGDGINISEGVISTTPISIKTEKFSFVNSGSHQPTYNYSGVTIYDDRYISGTKYGIAFDEADIKPRTTITSPNGVRTVCFALDQSVRRKIETAITSISVNNVEQVNINGAVDLTIPNASITEKGLMSKEDKVKLDSQPIIKASDATGVTDDDYVVIKKSEYQSILNRLSALENNA